MFNHALVVSLAVAELVHNPDSDLVFLHRLFDPLSDHLVIAPTLVLHGLHEGAEVVQGQLSELFLPTAMSELSRLFVVVICQERGVVVFEVGLEVEGWGCKDGVEFGLDGTDLGLVVDLDRAPGVEV